MLAISAAADPAPEVRNMLFWIAVTGAFFGAYSLSFPSLDVQSAEAPPDAEEAGDD